MLEDVVAPGVRVGRIEPLQRRVDRNRWKFVAFMLAFTTFVSVGFAIVVASGLGVALAWYLAWIFRGNDPLVAHPMALAGQVLLLSFGMSFVASGAWALVRLARSDVTLIRRLDARVPRPGTYLPTRSALRDMAIAAGIKPVPTFYIIETSRVNAFVLGRSLSRVRIGMTTGMIEKIPLGEQRAVFANLIARVVSRDTLWATAVSALMGPIWGYREHDLTRDADFESGERLGDRTGVTSAAPVGGFVVFGAAALVTEALAWYHQEAAWKAAEKADAEGMMLLKHPRAMLDAIEHVLERDNHVPSAGDAYSTLFFCWAGFGFAPEDDPEMRRVARLREALGAEGAPRASRPNLPEWPRPPRLEIGIPPDGEA